ncbi:phospholipase D family protein [Neobacillus niacini]|uniref:phospholipase D family protein n=1 Tax=Neobacillus niacini TaxID=86668 RepID=UPI00203EAFEA|nr:phospholipase D family protein [Neobacillus niacini]MCM3693227.1 phospholipase D family protein [Neobacillus niacini]
MLDYQTSLFEEEELPKKNVSYLHILKDMKPIQMTTKEIFDTDNYQELCAVTYVASPTYFFNKTKDFIKVDLVMGIDDSRVAGGFTEGLLTKFNYEVRLNFWNELDQDIRSKFLKERCSIRYAANNVAIHSKIYLLKGEKGTRCIIGSANFTANAFESRPQFEDILIFDNNQELYNMYMERFKELKTFTDDFIPERIKRGTIEQVLVNDPETIAEIIRDETLGTKIKFHITEEQMEEISLVPEIKNSIREENEKVKQIIELVTKRDNKNGVRVPVSKGQFEKKIPAIKTVISRTNKNSQDLDLRKMLICNPSNNLLYTSFQKENEVQQNELILVSKELEKEDIKDRLLLLHSFIDAYKTFTLKEDPRNQARIYEVFLYGFMSAYLWKAREHYALHEGREGSRRDISPFLIIAGRSMSGKTTALEFLGRLLGGNGPNFISYESLKSANTLEDFFESENLHPILIDEINLSFFTGKRGERIIKFVSNQLAGKHPVLIGTTNASGFNIPAQATSRIYYLQIENTFDKHKKTESSAYLHNILQQVDNKLFGDFTYRLSNRIINDKKFYDPKDNLTVAREIFRNYYKICGLEVPNYFPNEPFNDYDDRGKLIWKELFRSYKDAFEIRSDNTISIKIENFSGNIKERQTKINYLPIECIIEDEPVLVVKRDIFFSFIDLDNGERNIFNKIKKLFSKS